MIAIVDCGVGNLFSLKSIAEFFIKSVVKVLIVGIVAGVVFLVLFVIRKFFISSKRLFQNRINA